MRKKFLALFSLSYGTKLSKVIVDLSIVWSWFPWSNEALWHLIMCWYCTYWSKWRRPSNQSMWNGKVYASN